jgi:hypothetical protein
VDGTRDQQSGAARGKLDARRGRRAEASEVRGWRRSRWIRTSGSREQLLSCTSLTHSPCGVRAPSAATWPSLFTHVYLPADFACLLRRRVLYQPTRRLLSSSARLRSLPSTQTRSPPAHPKRVRVGPLNGSRQHERSHALARGCGLGGS